MLLALFALAHAGDIAVIADSPVSVEVDGRLVPTRPGERGATATGLAGGAHKVQVFDAQDRLLAAATVSVGVSEEVRLELRRGQLTELGRGPLAATQPAPAQPAPPTAPPTATCPDPVAAPGSFQLTGISPKDVAVWVDGRPVGAVTAGFVAQGLTPGPHDVRIAQGSRTIFSGDLRIYPDLVRRCIPTVSGLDCVMVETLVAIAPPAAPPPATVPPPAPARAAMADRDFTALVAAIEKESFSSNQVALVNTAAGSHWFTIDQVGQVMDALTHSSDKVAAAKLLRPRVLDPQNAWKLSEHLTFSSDKDAVQALFR